MNKGQNIIHESRIKRTVEYAENSKQINILDQRFYRFNDEYYPSVSTILNYFPKGKFFEDWIKANGFNSEIIAAKAAEEGKQVHDAAERFINGEEIEWLDQNGTAKYSLDVWRMILKFADFWNRYKPKVISVEYHLFSPKYKYAGTADLIVEIENEMWLLDIKTSNSLHTKYDLQTAAYASAWNETHDVPITKTGILWLKAATRTDGKNGVMQSKGWQVKIIDNIEKNLETFLKIQDIYKLENPNDKPIHKQYPTSIKLEINEKM